MVTRARAGITKPNHLYDDYVMKADVEVQCEEACLLAAEEPASVVAALNKEC